MGRVTEQRPEMAWICKTAECHVKWTFALSQVASDGYSSISCLMQHAGLTGRNSDQSPASEMLGRNGGGGQDRTWPMTSMKGSRMTSVRVDWKAETLKKELPPARHPYQDQCSATHIPAGMGQLNEAPQATGTHKQSPPACQDPNT